MKVLINRSDALGDVLLALPVAQRIKQKYGASHIIFLVEETIAPVLDEHPWIDEVWTLPRKQRRLGRFFSLLKRFRYHRPDYYFHLGGFNTPSFVAWLLRVRIRAGVLARPWSFLFLNHGVRQHRSMVEMHEAEYNLNVLAPLDLPYDYHMRDEMRVELKLRLNETDMVTAEWDERLRSQGAWRPDWQERLIFVYAGAHGKTLNWSPRQYARYIQAMDERFPGRWIFVLIQDDTSRLSTLVISDLLAPHRVQSLASRVMVLDMAKVGIRRIMTMMPLARLYVGAASGMLHLANAFRIPIVALYSPIKVQSTFRWAPFNRAADRIKLMVPEAVCGEVYVCAGPRCPYYPCMENIDVSWVVRESESVLNLDSQLTEG